MVAPRSAPTLSTSSRAQPSLPKTTGNDVGVESRIRLHGWRKEVAGREVLQSQRMHDELVGLSERIKGGREPVAQKCGVTPVDE